MDFFEFHSKVNQRKPPSQVKQSAGPQREVLSVSALTSMIDRALRDCLPQVLTIQGEVSNCNLHSGSGHLYFTLKDRDACIDCVMFKSDASRLKFMPEDGIELLASGYVKVYGQRGRYQFYASRLESVGRGALEVAFRQLVARLEAEGLFAPERKKPLPRYPQHVALVTGRETAALADCLKVLRRFPWVRVMLWAVPVQGEGAAERIAFALSELSRCGAHLNIDMILLVRGGGSLEDLWEFNEEIVARAIVASSIPIVTGIGHEIDVSVADLAADYHAHTPTEAAQVAMAHWRGARDSIEQMRLRLNREVRDLITQAGQRLREIQRHAVFLRPLERINACRQMLDERQRTMAMAMSLRIGRSRSRLDGLASRLSGCHPRHLLSLHRQRTTSLAARLDGMVRQLHQHWRSRMSALAAHLNAIGPEQVLKRGYSITTLKKKGVVVRSASQVKEGDRLVTRLADGTIESTAEDSRQLPLFD